MVPVLSDPTEKQLRRRVIRNLLLLAIPAILFLPAAAILIVTERIRELRDRGVPGTWPIGHWTTVFSLSLPVQKII